MAVDKILKIIVMDAKVVRDMFEESDHYAELMKMNMSERWKFKRRMEKENETFNT